MRCGSGVVLWLFVFQQMWCVYLCLKCHFAVSLNHRYPEPSKYNSGIGIKCLSIFIPSLSEGACPVYIAQKRALCELKPTNISTLLFAACHLSYDSIIVKPEGLASDHEISGLSCQNRNGKNT